MYIWFRYIFVFLTSISLLSHRGETVLQIDDYPVFHFWGNTADVIVEDGNGEIAIDSMLGTSFLFPISAGKIFSLCFGSCRIHMKIPKDIPVHVRMLSGNIEVCDRKEVDITVDSGLVSTRNVSSSRISLLHGFVDGIVPAEGTYLLTGHNIQAQIYSNKEWSYEILHKGKSFLSTSDSSVDAFAKVEFFEGKIELLSDGIANRF